MVHAILLLSPLWAGMMTENGHFGHHLSVTQTQIRGLANTAHSCQLESTGTSRSHSKLPGLFSLLSPSFLNGEMIQRNNLSHLFFLFPLEDLRLV